MKAAICEGSTELYLDGVFLRGVFIPTSPLHPADRACLAPDHINGPTQLPGTKHRHLVRLTSTKGQFSLLSADFFHAFFPTWETSLKLGGEAEEKPICIPKNFSLSRGEFGLSEHPE